ncbi:MAG: phosphatase PAP2 family protein [Paracoccaceae bacterium]
MTDHAGGASSTLLSSALVSTRDATVGAWQGEVTAERIPELGTTISEYLDNIRMPSRALMLETTLRSRSSVQHVKASPTSEVEVSMVGEKLAKVGRPEEEYFEKQLDWVRAYVDLRGDRNAEIFLQKQDLLSFFGAQAYLDNGRREYTLMLLDVVRNLAIHVETPMKFHLRALRPIDFAMEVQPIIQTPDHSSYPSGHATEAYAMATVLYLLSHTDPLHDGLTAQALPFRLAYRIATNRTVAGVHFPVDSLAGAFTGCILGQAISALANNGNYLMGDLVDFPVNADQTTPDFLPGDFAALFLGSTNWSAGAFTKDTILAEVWRRAADEWVN